MHLEIPLAAGQAYSLAPRGIVSEALYGDF